jgi:hypothetical protein
MNNSSKQKMNKQHIGIIQVKKVPEIYRLQMKKIFKKKKDLKLLNF